MSTVGQHAPVPAVEHAGLVRANGVGDATSLVTIYIVLLFGIPSNVTINGLGSLGRPALLWGLVLFAFWMLSRLQWRNVDVDRISQPVRIAFVVYLVIVLVSFSAAMLRGQPADQISPAMSWIVSLVVAGIVGTGALLGGAATSALSGSGSEVSFDKDGALGKLDAWSKKMDAAGKQLEAAQKSGDADAQSKALGAVMGAALGGGDQVEALAPDQLKPFVPDTLGGLPRTSMSVQRNGVMGMQVATASASYGDDSGHSLQLEVTDTGSAKGMMAMAGWAALQNESETDRGYEKTYKQNGRIVHEQWDKVDKHGEFSLVLGDRFTVKVSGNAESMDQLKAAVASLNLAGLEALKGHGVKNG